VVVPGVNVGREGAQRAPLVEAAKGMAYGSAGQRPYLYLPGKQGVSAVQDAASIGQAFEAGTRVGVVDMDLDWLPGEAANQRWTQQTDWAAQQIVEYAAAVTQWNQEHPDAGLRLCLIGHSAGTDAILKALARGVRPDSVCLISPRHSAETTARILRQSGLDARQALVITADFDFPTDTWQPPLGTRDRRRGYADPAYAGRDYTHLNIAGFYDAQEQRIVSSWDRALDAEDLIASGELLFAVHSAMAADLDQPCKVSGRSEERALKDWLSEWIETGELPGDAPGGPSPELDLAVVAGSDFGALAGAEREDLLDWVQVKPVGFADYVPVAFLDSAKAKATPQQLAEEITARAQVTRPDDEKARVLWMVVDGGSSLGVAVLAALRGMGTEVMVVSVPGAMAEGEMREYAAKLALTNGCGAAVIDRGSPASEDGGDGDDDDDGDGRLYIPVPNASYAFPWLMRPPLGGPSPGPIPILGLEEATRRGLIEVESEGLEALSIGINIRKLTNDEFRLLVAPGTRFRAPRGSGAQDAAAG